MGDHQRDDAVPGARLTSDDVRRIKERSRARGGNMKTCGFCGRRHKRRTICRLTLAKRVAKSGRVVQRWVHG